MRRILASIIALAAVFATAPVDATVFFCGMMDGVAQHPCCPSEHSPIDTLRSDGDGCCDVAQISGDDSRGTTPDAPVTAVAFAVVELPMPAATPSRVLSSGPTGLARGPPVYLLHRALLI